MRSHKLADFTDGKPCPTSHGESVATLGPEPTSATFWPELLPGHMGWASGGTWAGPVGKGDRHSFLHSLGSASSTRI